MLFRHISKTPLRISYSQICFNTPMFGIATIFVKCCYTTGSWLLQLMSQYTFFGLITARAKSLWNMAGRTGSGGNSVSWGQMVQTGTTMIVYDFIHTMGLSPNVWNVNKIYYGQIRGLYVRSPIMMNHITDTSSLHLYTSILIPIIDHVTCIIITHGTYQHMTKTALVTLLNE